ncbi:hypothetical protein PROFUN_05294 [Planoprotostelium fungivorum]|uniref:Uncharacterized protein n=1 Tax=Planoprotostelium fungivorum TaxID=1890364 RepID=A0A2P6NRB6_9EUKA|nr:hypothetical protein PROFUN_08166 [Planoprotostelium fungivorum]PRP86512.1 hypothetical protein PROFUN_05294 [Planoprotostelium fungivorum]
MSNNQTPTAPVVVKQPSIGKTILKNLVMGGIAGIIGACSTFPLDMVKTRMQNQRGAVRQYNGVLDCFRKIIAAEGVRGLYRGLPAQLVGITPEKAIKLTINDYIRYASTDKKTGKIKLQYEVLAGMAAGLSQVVATNPYEIVKVRLQTQALEGAGRKSGITVVRELGFRGLFKGSAATLLRDVPFSALYFSLYGNLKAIQLEKQQGKPLSVLQLFVASSAAGMFAGGLVTPADVIKTRIQVKQGAVPYKGIADCFNRILKEEGPRALYKGAVPRMMIISPLFGITLVVYEKLQRYFL